MSNEEIDDLFKCINDGVYLTLEIQEKVVDEEAEPLVQILTADTSIPMDTSSGNPPPENVIPTPEQIVVEAVKDLSFQPPLKRKGNDPRVGVIFPDLSQSTETPQTSTAAPTSFIPTQEGPISIHEAGGSSAGLSVSSPRPHHDIVSERLAMHMAQNLSPPCSSRGKGISIEEGALGDEDTSVPELRKEIDVLSRKLIEKDLVINQQESRIADLEASNAQLIIRVDDLKEDKATKTERLNSLHKHLETLLACYFDLKQNLTEELGDKFKSSVEILRVEQPSQATPGDSSTPRTTQFVDHFEKEPVQAPHIISIKKKKLRDASKKKNIMFKRNSDQNAPSNQPKITLTNLDKKRFVANYGDRTGIVSWAFHDRLNLCGW